MTGETMATDFDGILDQCLADLASGQATIESCLKRYPNHAGQLSPLLLVAEKVRAMPVAPALSQRQSLLSTLLAGFFRPAGSS